LCVLAAGVPAPAGATAAAIGDAPEIVSERNGEIVLMIRPRPDETSPLPRVRFYVAIPPGAVGRVEAVRIGGGFEPRPLRPGEIALYKPSEETGNTRVPPGLFPSEPVQTTGPFTYRNTRVIAVDCYLRQLDSEGQVALDWSGYQVAVRYPPAADKRLRSDADPMLADLVINRSVFPAPASGPARTPGQGPLDPHFSNSQNWLKIEITDRGMYVITYEDLSNLLVPSEIGAIDPATLRMFSGSGIEQLRDLNDPDASWRIGNWMTGANDRIVFYALGAQGWLDHFDPAAPDTVYHTHGRAEANYYYLTWNGNFPGQPLRIQDVRSTPVAGGDRTSYQERLFYEKNRVSDYHFGGDHWLWEKITRASQPKPLTIKLNDASVSDLVTSVPQEFRTVALAPYQTSTEALPYNAGHHAVYVARTSVFDEHIIGEFRWDAAYSDHSYEDGKPLSFAGSFLADGNNEMLLRLPKDDNVKDWMYFAWYSVAYERRLRSMGGRLGFSSPDTSGVVNFRVSALPDTDAGNVHVFDVTDHFNVWRLTDLEVAADGGNTRRARFSSSHGGSRRHFWTVVDDGLMSVDRKMGVLLSGDLRAVTASTAPTMVIVTDPLRTFKSAADRLAAHRRNYMPHFDQGGARVEVVTTTEIYDNFSGGQTDPFAIRNYVKFLYDNFTDSGNPVLRFVCLLGDASLDHKNHASPSPDRVPTFIMEPENWWEEWFASDEWYGHLDVADQVVGYGVADVGIGRLPAGSDDEADALVDKVIGYELSAPLGVWRNQVILVADDEGTSCEDEFTYQSEDIAHKYLPNYTDVQKVYLTEFPSVSRLKPAARNKLIELWNAGAVAVNYIGHGSSLQMADEIVFVDDDVAKLNNGLKLPVVLAFSCTVGDFANPLKESLSENLLLRQAGGAIGTVTASALSDRWANAKLAFATFNNMLPKVAGDGIALGEAMVAAKLGALIAVCPSGQLCGHEHQESTNWRYNLLSDPALRVIVPRLEVRLVPEEPDTLVAGIRRSVRGAVYRNGEIDTGFDGSVDLRMHEPDVRRIKIGTSCSFAYYLRGGTLYRGVNDVVQGEFVIDFRVPRFAIPGNRAFFTAYANDGSTDAAGSTDTTFSLMLPSIADTTLLKPVDGPPRVQLGFKSGLEVVKPGESLQAIIRDQDGINILSTTTEGRHSLLIDNSPVPVDVTRFFTFDQGGTDTSGVLTYPLPEMSVGDHRAILRVSDSFAQTTLDTLLFSVTDPMDYFAEVVYNYPNPFSTTTQFLIHLSNRASIRLDIFTISGKRIRRLEELRDGGEEWISWDGRDAAGDEIANGTYLYVATVEFLDINRAPLKIRGKLTKIQ
jgi:hypothetical protein